MRIIILAYFPPDSFTIIVKIGFDCFIVGVRDVFLSQSHIIVAPLAGNEDSIPRLRHAQGFRDGFLSIRDPDKIPFFTLGDEIIYDSVHILRAGIISSKNDQV